MRRRARGTGWRTWVLGAVGTAVAGMVLARRSEGLRELRSATLKRLRDTLADVASAASSALPAAGASAPGDAAASVSPAPAKRPAPRRALRPSPRSAPRRVKPPRGTAASEPATASAPESWVASRVGTVYYRGDCRAVTRIAEANRVVFATESEAEAAGFRRSSAPGC